MTDNTPKKRKGSFSEEGEGRRMRSKKVDWSPTASTTPSVIVSPVNFPLEILKRYQAKEFEEALSLIDQFYKLPPTHPQYRKEDARAEFQIIQATCWNSMGINQAEADNLLQNVLERDPNNSFALYAYGVMLYNNGDFRGSIEPFDKAIELNPASMRRAMEYRAKAATLSELMNSAHDDYQYNRFTQMIETLRIAKQVEPTNAKICLTVEKIREFFIGQIIRRLENDALGKKPEHYENIEQLILEYKLKEARPLIEKIRSELPRVSEGAFLIGLYAYVRGELNDATKHFAEAIHLNRNSEKYKEYYDKANETHLRLLEVEKRMESHDYLAALHKLNLSEIDAKNLVVKQLMHFNRGHAYMNLDRKVEAREELIKYCQLTPIVGNMMEHALAGISVEDEKEDE